MIKSFRIQQYDPAVVKPPFQFITLVERIEFDEPEDDHLGEKRGDVLREICAERGYNMRFLSTSSVDGVDYDVVVRGELEDDLGIYDTSGDILKVWEQVKSVLSKLRES